MALHLDPLESSFQDELTCGQVLHQLPNRTGAELCAALNATSSCYFQAGFLDYMIIVYCHFQDVHVLGIILMFLWLVLMLVGLATTADTFFGPSLIVISDTLHLTQNLAGVTLLALGNGAPDIFASVSAVNNIKGGDAGLAFGALLGGGMYISCMTTGVISFVKSFKAMSRPVVKDLVFLLFMVFCTFVIIFKRKIELWEAIGFILMYGVYVMTTVGSQALYTRGCGRGPKGVDDGEINDEEVESGTRSYRRRSDCDLPGQLPAALPATVVGVSNPAFVHETVGTTGGADRQLGGDYDDSIEPGRLRRVDASELGANGLTRPQRRTSEASGGDRSPKRARRPSRLSMQMVHVSRLQRHEHQQRRQSTAKANGVISPLSSSPPSRKTSTHEFTGISRRANYLARWMLAHGDMEAVEHRGESRQSSAQPSRSHSVASREQPASIAGRQQRQRVSESSAAPRAPSRLLRPPSLEAAGRPRSSHGADRELPRIDSVDENLDEETLDRLNRIKSLREAEAEAEAVAGDNAEAQSTAREDRAATDGDTPQQPGGAFKEFLLSLCPLDIDAFPIMTWYNKIYEIVKAPLLFLLLVTTPLVDYDRPLNGWSRILNSIHCATAPLFIGAAFKGWTWYIGSVPVLPLLPAAGLLLGALVFFTSSDFQPPRYHNVFSFAGFLTAIVWIYTFANEIVNVLESAGYILRISSTILGLTVLAWANSIGDMIANSLMARQNFPRVAISACFGGPLFNLLLGVGIPFTLKLISGSEEDGVKDMAMVLVVSEVEVLLCAFLALSMLVSMLVLTITDYHVTRPYGVVLMVLYVAFLVVMLLTTQGIIRFL